MTDRQWINVSLILSGIAIIATTIFTCWIEDVRYDMQIQISKQLSQPAYNIRKANENLSTATGRLNNRYNELSKAKENFDKHIQRYHNEGYVYRELP